MVAHAGRGWQLAASLVALESEADALAPRRSKRSDGSIGDTAHASRTSDHNIDGGFCHAIDLTHDPAGGFDAHAHARRTAANNDKRIKYVISNRQIWQPGRGWRPYSGANPHDKHAHWSVWHTAAARNDTSPWLLGHRPQPPEQVQPPPTINDTGVPSMFIGIHSVGLYALFGQVLFKFTETAQFTQAVNASPKVPVLTVGDEVPQAGRQYLADRLQEASNKATGG